MLAGFARIPGDGFRNSPGDGFDKKRMVARVRIYMLQGMTFEDAKARAEGRDVVAGPMRPVKKKTKQNKPRTSQFIDAEALASDEEESDEDEESEGDRDFIDDDEQVASFGPMTAAR